MNVTVLKYVPVIAGLLLCFMGSESSYAQTASFDAGSIIVNNDAYVDAPYFVIAADLDNDNDDDILFASVDAIDMVGWYENRLNEPAGNFSDMKLITDTLLNPRSIHPEDMDGDGDLDLLIASDKVRTVAYIENRLNEPTNDFARANILLLSNEDASYITAADIDLDGDKDIVCSYSSNDEIFWIPNDLNGVSGAFGSKVVISTSADMPKCIQAADFDGDGDEDLLIASEADDKISILSNRMNEVTADFAPEYVISTNADGARFAYPCDIDGDGDIDIVSASIIDDKVAWYENRMNEVTSDFSTENVLSITSDKVQTVRAADMDNDGDLDIMASSYNDNKIALFENRLNEVSADFSTEQVISTAGEGPRTGFLSDLDGDNDPDIVTAFLVTDQVGYIINRINETGGGFDQFKTINRRGVYDPRDVHTADMDGDGDEDILVASYSDYKISYYENRLNSPSQDIAPQVIVSLLADGATGVQTADVDGDGDLDIVSTGYLFRNLCWYENRLNEATNDFGSQQVLEDIHERTYDVAISDFNGDGSPDFVFSNEESDLVRWYKNRLNDPTWNSFTGPSIVSQAQDGPRSLCASDLDGDGDDDVIIASVADHTISWYINQADVPTNSDFGNQLPISDAADTVISPIQVKAGDMDGDGDNDVIFASNADDMIGWYENRLNEASVDFGPKQVISINADNARSVEVHDFDGDGDLDVISASLADDKVALYVNRLNEPTADFAPEQIITLQANGAQSIHAADLDNDGDVDVVCASKYDNTVQWFANSIVNNPNPPVIVNNGLTVDQGSTTVLSNSDLQVYDPSNPPNQVTYNLVSVPARGELQKSNNALAQNATFTQSDIDNGLIRYVNDGQSSDNDAFSFTVNNPGGQIFNTSNFYFVVNDTTGNTNPPDTTGNPVDTNNTVGFGQIERETRYKVWPVPSADVVNVDIEDGAFTTGELVVSNAVGQVLQRQKLEPLMKVSMAPYGPGYYFFNIFPEGGDVLLKKVIIR